ncbi:phage late control D family protein, partial [Escherichia coli 90.0091]
CPVR